MTIPAGSPSYVQHVLSRNRLTLQAVVSFVVAAAAPLTVIAGGAVTAVAVTGITAIPVGYLVIAVALALFSVGYVAMSRHVVNAGAFYAYIARGLGPVIGVGAAAVAVFAYNGMQVGLYGAFGAVASAILAGFGLSAPWWAWALIAWVIVGVLGLLDIKANGRLLLVLLAVEVLIVVVYDAVMIGHPAGGVLRWDTLDPRQLADPSIAAGMVAAVAGFVGFEATVAFSEEVRDPRRTIPRATYIALGLIGVLYGLSAWAMSAAVGPDQFVARAKSDGPELMFNLVLPYLGKSFVDLGHLLFLTSLFAALLAFHHMVTRYTFALGRERVLPRAFGNVARRTGAPKTGSLAQSGLALVVIALSAWAGWDPITVVFGRLTAWGGLGVLILMAFTSIAVIAFFGRHGSRGESLWRRVVAPLIAAVLLAALTVITVANFGALLQEPGSFVGWAMAAAYGVAAAVGLFWALILRTGRPGVYRRIGLGVESASPQPPPRPDSSDRRLAGV